MPTVPSSATDAGGVEIDYGAPESAVAALKDLVDAALAELHLPDAPEALYEPVRYVLAGQGKRLRPVFLLLAADAFGTPPASALPAALAVEVFHNFTLVHDDIMDHADTRRGRPTVHVRWDTDTAILCGDYLMALSYDLLARSEAQRLPRLMRSFSEMVTHLCEGQTLDKAFETDEAVTVEQYLHMIDRKTGALLRTVLELGGLLGSATDAQLDALRRVGASAGRAFQIQDDLLDLIADGERWGKTVGGDLIEGKKTFLLLQALERADGAERAWFARVVEDRGLSPDEIPEARERMDRLGVLDAARTAVARYSATAMSALDTLPEHPALQTLRWLIRRLQARHH
ncbi:MAG: polyprenyl synthetase family protein [Bacteroidetes bacterium]|jgi:geranylgeranyl diphosphate synthase type II|nr:polyprenyl synthetase family protein [Bacteroidota bacterium]